VLERDVEVGHDLAVRRHRLDQAVGHVAGIGVHHANPGHVWHGNNELVEQRRQPVFLAQVVAVVGRILGDQDQLLHAAVAQAARLVEDAIRRAADRRALDGRDRAEGARAAAAIRDLEIGAGALHRDPAHAALVGAHRHGLVGQVVDRLRVFARAQPPHQVDDVHPAARADHAVQPGHLARQIAPVALREASRGDQVLVRRFVGGQLAQRVEAFLAGGLDEAAGVDDQHLGAAGVVGAAQTRAFQQGGHRVGIDGVFRAAEAEQIIGVRASRHSSTPPADFLRSR